MHGRCCPNQATGVLPGRTAGTIHNKGVSMDVTHFKLTSKILFQPVDAGVLSPTALALGSQPKQVRCGFQCWFWEALGSSVQVLEVLAWWFRRFGVMFGVVLPGRGAQPWPGVVARELTRYPVASLRMRNTSLDVGGYWVASPTDAWITNLDRSRPDM